MTNMTLPDALRAARAAADLSLADLAARVGGVTRSALGQYETGAKVPPAPRLEQLARALGCTFAVGPRGWSVGKTRKD